jgi:hypothetical protein
MKKQNSAWQELNLKPDLDQRTMKSKRIQIFLLMFGLLITGGGSVRAEEQKTKNPSATEEKETTLDSLRQVAPQTDFDSILVIHFHPTVQCSCCINVGNFSKKGIEEYYSKPHQKWQVLFREINVDEDTLTSKKYQIFWSALGFEGLGKGEAVFKEIQSVWEFCEDEKRFLQVFKKELDDFLNELRADTTEIEQSGKNSK